MDSIFNKKTHYYWLDFLRFFSAFLVVVAHTRANFFEIFCNLDISSQTLSSKLFYFFTSFSDDGVLIFFILSGFLVGGRTFEKIINKEYMSASKFAINRAIRIGLPLVASLFIIAIFHTITGTTNNYIQLLGNLLSLQGILVDPEGGVLWTMPYIVWFYVFIFSIILIVKPTSRKSIIGYITLILSLSIFTLINNSSGTYFFFLMLSGIFSFYFSKRKLPKTFIFICIFIAITTAILTKFAKPTMSREPSILSLLSVPLLNLLETYSIAIIIGQMVRNIPRKKFAINFDRLFHKLAKFSYSLYLIHVPVIKLMLWAGFPRVASVNLQSIGLYILEIVICTISGYLFYLLVEKHTNSIRDLIVTKLQIK